MSEKDETTFALNQDDTGTKTVFETPWFSVEKFPTVLPGKDVVEPYYRIVQPDTVTGLVLTEDEKLVVVKQFRPAVGLLTIELPAGEAAESEPIEEAMAREVREETGYVCEKIEYLGRGNFMLNRAGWSDHIFVGFNGRKSENFKPEPGIEVLVMPPRQLAKKIIKGEFYSLSSLCAFTLAELKLGIRIFDGSVNHQLLNRE